MEDKNNLLNKNIIASLNIKKILNKSIAVVGDEITYTLELVNNGNVFLENIIVYDILMSNLLFIAKSVKIDGISDPFSNIINGINIGALNVGESKVITFKVKALNNNVRIVENLAKGIFKYRDTNGNIYSENTISNIAKLIIEVANLDVLKSANKDFVILNDLIIYEIIIKNTGTVDALNIIFNDELSEAVEFLDGSFMVNGRIINAVNINEGINIGNILVNCSKVIKYAVKVTNIKSSKNIINSASVYFEYILNNGIQGYKKSEKTLLSSKIITVGINSFKQINVDDFMLEEAFIKPLEEIIEIIPEVKILKYTIIKTEPIQSTEGKILTKYKAIIYGILDLTIEYSSYNKQHAIYSINNPIRFSTSLVLPETYEAGEPLEIVSSVEDIYFKDFDCKYLFVNTTLLIKAKLSDC